MMKIGMLWYDDDKDRTLAEKVEHAAAYYREKYGAAPNACFVNPAMLDSDVERVNGVVVAGLHTVRPNHFWVGVDETTIT